MPRLRNTRTGSVVNVSDDTAALLGPEYEPLEPEPEPVAKAPRRASSKPATKPE